MLKAKIGPKPTGEGFLPPRKPKSSLQLGPCRTLKTQARAPAVHKFFYGNQPGTRDAGGLYGSES